MKSLNALACAIAAAILCLAVPVLAAIQLVPVVSSGLSSPLFVGHAGDGSNRLFIVERAGIIKVTSTGSRLPAGRAAPATAAWITQSDRTADPRKSEPGR